MVHTKQLLILILCSTICFVSCKKEAETVVVDSGITLIPDSLAPTLKTQFGTWTTLVCQDNLPFMDTLEAIYAQRDFQPYWWNAILGDSADWADLEATFDHSQKHGMDPRYYYLPVVDYYRKKIENYKTADSAYRLIAECELIISNGLIRMHEDIANGRTDPKEVYGYTYMLPRNNRKEWDYTAFLESNNKIADIEAIHEGDTTYNELLKVMGYYLKKKSKERLSSIDFSDYPKLEVGDSAPVISQIIAKLKERNLPDSGIQNIADTALYTKELRTQIKRLQEKYSLTPDGIMGYKTYKLINASPTDKIDQVKANLERQRWFDKPKEGPFVYINMPKYDIDLHWKDSVKTFRVCIGKNLPDNYDAMVKEYTDSGWLYKLPKNMETPQIASRITYMVINPTWTVPYSIIKREMWWRLVKDPTYLSAKGFKVYRGKTEVNGDTINWSKVNKNRIPYRIVEDPGPRNSLGTVKYMFSNPFSIYLHDTPNKAAFRRTQRAVSHGCVRLQYPVLMGEFLMQNSRKYDADDFRIMMGYPPRDTARLRMYDPTDSTAAIQKLEETSKLRLDKPMPLYLDYRTVYYDRNWKLHFAYDIYDQNKLILKEMDRL